MQQQQGDSGGKQPNGGQQPQPKPVPQPGDQKKKSDSYEDALLRSVQQQEQEELTRMHKPSKENLHVGW
jgi:hypothetical protein